MKLEIHNESLIPNASTTGPVVPSNSNDCLIQSEEQVPVPGITMFATDLQLCLEGNTVTRTILRIAFPVLTTVYDQLSSQHDQFMMAYTKQLIPTQRRTRT